MMNEQAALRLFLEEIAREAGETALGHFGRVDIEPKGASLVSEADRAVERLARAPGRFRALLDAAGRGETPDVA